MATAQAGPGPADKTPDGSVAGQPLVEVRGLNVALPVGPKAWIEAVREVDLRVGPGERVGIVGESGSGKSVTGRAIAGLLPPIRGVQVRGSIRWKGEELVGRPESRWQELRRLSVSMVFQDPLSFLNPTMRVGRQVAEGYVPRPDAGRADAATMARRFMAKAGLSDPEAVENKYPFELSGGMRQRIVIAVALAKSPDLIIADEPTTALDVTVQAHVLASLDRCVAEEKASLIMISHDLAVVARMCDRVYVMRAGQVMESGPTAEVFRNPTHPYTRHLIRSVRNLTSLDEGLAAFGSEDFSAREPM